MKGSPIAVTTRFAIAIAKIANVFFFHKSSPKQTQMNEDNLKLECADIWCILIKSQCN